MAHYAARKAASSGLTKALAVELARHGITVNTIPPSLVDTRWPGRPKRRVTFPASTSSPHGPARRAGTPADIAAACSFLCAESGSYITGQVIG